MKDKTKEVSMSLLDDLLAKPVAPKIPKREKGPEVRTQRFESTPDATVIDYTMQPEVPFQEALRDHGLDPADWEMTHFSRWQISSGEWRASAKYRRVINITDEDIDELLDSIDAYSYTLPAGLKHGDANVAYIVAMGDMQFGKIDGDGVEGTVKRAFRFINEAADRYRMLRAFGYDIGHVHLAWLGDHIEGFLSQGGANSWRTQLPLKAQERLVRRLMTYAMCTFAPLVDRLTMAAIPGNHGETVRFNGKGQTRYDDSNDTEALIAVSDAAALAPERFRNVEFYVPETDELTLVLDVAGLPVLHAHGHQWRPNKHFEWWKGQAFNSDQAEVAGLLIAGHMHHDHIEREGRRLFVGVSSFESESTWFRHTTGATGRPGVTGILVVDGDVRSIDFINSQSM